MTNSFEEALTKLQTGLDNLNAQDVSHLPAAQLAMVEKSKAALYGEIQRLQAQQIEARDADYAVITSALRDSKADLTALSGWIAGKKAQDRAIFSMLSKGISIVLSLLA
tara:strand:- start:894 stop:1220 length:327 start_codon:yes stop_codon:yes gene_type:complete